MFPGKFSATDAFLWEEKDSNGTVTENISLQCLVSVTCLWDGIWGFFSLRVLLHRSRFFPLRTTSLPQFNSFPKGGTNSLWRFPSTASERKPTRQRSKRQLHELFAVANFHISPVDKTKLSVY